MGHSALKINPIDILPHNVWDCSGTLIGTYFPASNSVRFTDGKLVKVDSQNRIKEADGSVSVLNRSTFVMTSVSSNSVK